jgi:hypothetical protein
MNVKNVLALSAIYYYLYNKTPCALSSSSLKEVLSILPTSISYHEVVIQSITTESISSNHTKHQGCVDASQVISSFHNQLLINKVFFEQYFKYFLHYV